MTLLWGIWGQYTTHLHVIVAVEGLAAHRTGELGRADQNLCRGGDPVLAFREAAAASLQSLPLRQAQRVIYITTAAGFAVLQVMRCVRGSQSAVGGAGRANVQGDGDVPIG